MTISFLPIVAQAGSSLAKAQPKQQAPRARAVAQPLEPGLARSLRLADRASRTRSGQALNTYLAAVWARFDAWNRRRVTRLVLRSLDERTLADIGVHRGDIDTLVREIEVRKARWYVNA